MQITPLDAWITNKMDGAAPAAWQLQKLNETLALVNARSSFYREHFSGLPRTLASLDELQRFPFTTAGDIRANPLQFVCVSQDEISRVVTLQSSGTSGLPKRLYFTAEDQYLTIDFFGVGMSTLTRPGERVMILLPVEKPGCVGDLLRRGLQRLGRIPLAYGPVRDPWCALQAMLDNQADCLVGSPTQVLGLARRWNPKNKAPRTVLLSTDYVPEAIVKYIEETWGCEVYNHYGATEMGLGGGVECEARQGYHLREADLFFEIIDPLTGESLPEGQYGEIVFSTLTRQGLPLIRYRMGDRSRFLPGACACGTKLRRLEKVSGRFEGFVHLKSGVLQLADFDEALFGIPGLLNFELALTGSPGQEILELDVCLLEEKDIGGVLQEALGEIKALQDVQGKVSFRANPGETGSLQKRVLMDRRVKEPV